MEFLGNRKSKFTCRCGNKRTFEEVYYHGSRTGEGSVNVSTLFLRPKKEKFPTNNKSEEFKSISSLSKILDGRSKTNEGLNKTRKRNNKNRPERCIFQYSSPPSLKKIVRFSC